MVVYNKLVMKKLKALFIAICTMGLITGCIGAPKALENNLKVEKSYEVTQTIYEPFAESYYNIDELKDMILSEAASHNQVYGSGNVSVNKVSLNGENAEVILKYASSDDFDKFNGVKLYVGTIENAVAKEESLKVILTDVTDPTKTISEPDIKALTGDNILITECADTVFLPSKVLFASDNVDVLEGGRSVKKKDGETGLIYVIYN